MNPTRSQRAIRLRRGLALGLVVLVGIAVLVLGIAMITTSGGQLLGGVDSKQRIKARIAAETQANLEMALAVENASALFGGNMHLPNRPMGPLPTGDGLTGSAQIEPVTENGTTDKIVGGPFDGMMGYRQSFIVHSVGVAPGGAKSKIDAQIKMYQVPVFQFGVFYDGNLEITPGLSMTVTGPVHSNGSIFLRSPTNPGPPATVVQVSGPVTAVGSIYHWASVGGGTLKYFQTPEVSPNGLPTGAAYLPALGTQMQAMSSFPIVAGKPQNFQWSVPRLSLPIAGAVPNAILLPRSPTDSPALTRQKFDAQIKCDPGCPPSRFVVGADAQPAWITGPFVFFDRREQAWVKFWDFDVQALTASGNKDSIFYMADTSYMAQDSGTLRRPVIKAFRIRNAARLPRNMTIATPNPVYVVGDFNAPNNPACAPYGGTTDPQQQYCNAMIACDVLTLVTDVFATRTLANAGMAGSLEQDFNNARWTPILSGSGAQAVYAPEPLNGVTDAPQLPPVPGCPTCPSPVTLNAAIMAGNKPTSAAFLPPLNTSDGVFNANYEGGLHNVIRYLEDLSAHNVAVNFKGSFICLWEGSTRGLNRNPNVRVINPGNPGGYYVAPTRGWAFDPRFTNLKNMPPATPFLTTPPTVSWSELK